MTPREISPESIMEFLKVLLAMEIRLLAKAKEVFSKTQLSTSH